VYFSAPLWLTIGLPVLIGMGMVAGWIAEAGKSKTAESTEQP